MSYSRPSITQLIDDIKADLYSRFPTLDKNLENGFASNLAEVISAVVNGTYSAIEYESKQPFAQTADSDNLEIIATNDGLSIDSATLADGDCVFTGLIGSQVITGSILVSSSGQRYTVDTGFTLVTTSETHSITAQAEGEAGNLTAGNTLSFVSVPSGMDSTITVDAGGLTGGTDREDDEAFRARLLFNRAKPPRGGADYDYIRWTQTATEATRVWVRNVNNNYGDAVASGGVWVYFAMDNTYDDGLPSAGDVTDVFEYIDPIKPVDLSEFQVIAPTASDIDFNITIVPDTPTNQANVETELKGAIRNNGIVGGTIKLSAFYNAMSDVSGLTDWDINSINSVTPADVVAGAGDLHTFGSITFV